ncbi:hypothetical protein FBU59_000769 [Linderina macrospora]|uniref:Uncharacterized protein n=1 Tax=Linderina macrospora TaxID=4868 RepID=A0ACC1JFX6_9FUNG|nr:hypothetical protein FBU59_000769 [Linderina macrospora]
MEPTTASYVDQYLKAGVAPFNIMNLLMSSYEGLAAMANMVAHDILGAYGADEKIAILETLNSKIVENFDCQSADREFETTHQLPEYIGAMLPHQFWRKTIYRLSERYPKSTMLSASIQYIADQGFQAEMTSLNSASLHTHVFYSLLAECFEKVAPADDDVIKERLRELVQLVCRREQTYVVAQYVLRNVRQRVGVGAAALARIEDELEAEMLEKYGRPQLVVNIRLLLEGFVVGGNDSVANAVASIIQSGHAAPGDVVSLYKQYYAAHTDKSRDPASKPPVHVLRSDRVMLPIIEQAFGHLWNSTQFNEREELMAKYIWLIAYGTLCTCDSTHMDVVDDTAISQLVAQLKEVRTGLPTSPTQTLLNSVVLKVLEWISVPIISRIVLLWMREVISYSNFTFYQMYYRSSEPPVPLLLLEEIAYRHPLQKPKVFETYCESFESKVPDFPAEKQIKLQKAVINRMAVLVQLDYSAPVLRYFDSKSEYMDESIVVYFIQRTLAQFEPPYPPEFAKPMIKLIMRAWNGIKVADEKERVHVRAFLAALESTDDVARRLLASLPEPVSPVAEL